MRPPVHSVNSIFTVQYRLPLGLAAIVALLLVQQLGPFSCSGSACRTLINSLHIPLFSSITLITAWCLPNVSFTRISALVIFIAIASELLQLFNTRSASVDDLVRNIFGWSIATLYLKAKWSEITKTLVPTALLLVTTLAPPSWRWYQLNQYHDLFPVLYEPGFWTNPHFVKSNSETSLLTTHDWGELGDRPALSITWSGKRWPNVQISEPAGDWASYHVLNYELYNLAQKNETLTVAVSHDGFRGTSRYVRRTVTPGHNLVSIPVDELIFSDSKEPQKIDRWQLHVTRSDKGKKVLLGRVYLGHR